MGCLGLSVGGALTVKQHSPVTTGMILLIPNGLALVASLALLALTSFVLSLLPAYAPLRTTLHPCYLKNSGRHMDDSIEDS